MADDTTGATPSAVVTWSVRALALQSGEAKAGAGESYATVQEQARRIMAGVNLRSIRYTELVQVADALRDAGALKAEDYLDFIGPSREFSTIGGGRNADWNEPRDMLDHHRQHLTAMESQGMEPRFVAFQKHLLGLFERFHALQGPAEA